MEPLGDVAFLENCWFSCGPSEGGLGQVNEGYTRRSRDFLAGQTMTISDRTGRGRRTVELDFTTGTAAADHRQTASILVHSRFGKSAALSIKSSRFRGVSACIRASVALRSRR